ncbi:ABC transporter substrate-binding protein [Paenibacillus septentrionalis]|uniref:ABC transporter substrate-binding protein n=1 Tax=Paenibacillus septentrionalis TaxID=429342 RepID=A0ABW1UZ75_9BACL
MKKVKLSLSLLLVMTMLFLAACGNNSNNAGSSNSDGNTGEEASLEPMTIRLASGDANPQWDNMQSDIGKVIKEKTGITIEQEFPVGGSDADMFALMVASDEYPDIVMPKGNVNKLVDAEALIDLRPLLEEHAPNIMKVYGEYLNRLVYSAEDDSIYTLPLDGVGQTYFDAGGGFQIQHQVLEELGYPEIKTVKDYENAIKTYLEQNPTTEDGQPRIGLSLNGGEWQILISVTNPAFYATGAPDDGEFYVNQENYEVVMHYQRPEEREYFRWLNHMNNIGLLDKESFVQKYDQYKSKIASGRVLGIIDQDWDYAEAENALKAQGKFNETYANFPVTLDETYKEASFMGTGYLASYGIGITIDAKDPVRIIKFLDYLASDEGQILVNWGIEGQHYTVDENGKRVIIPEVLEQKVNDNNTFKKQTGIGNYFMSARYGDGVLDSTGNYYTTNFPEQIIAQYTEADKKTLAAYGKTVYKDFWPADDEFEERAYGAGWTINFDTASDANVIFQKSQDVMKKYIPQAILADPADFDKIYDEFMAELDKINVAKMNAEYSELIKKRVDMWSK